VEQYLRLLNAALFYFKPVLIIAFNTGMRIGEIMALKWQYIDKRKWMIRLPKDITKENRDKNIPINHHVKTVLSQLPRSIPHNYVISHNGVPINYYDKLRRQFESTCKKAGIAYGTKIEQGIIFHDIRRTVKTNMVAAGIDKVHRDTIIGHSLIGMDQHYIVPTDESLTEAMGKYTEWLDSQINFANVDYSVDYEQNFKM